MLRKLVYLCVALAGIGTFLVAAPKAQAAYGDWVVVTNGAGNFPCSNQGDASSTANYLRSLGYTATIYYRGQVYAVFNIKVYRSFGRDGWSLIVNETSPNTSWIRQIYNYYNGMGSQFRIFLVRVF